MSKKQERPEVSVYRAAQILADALPHLVGVVRFATTLCKDIAGDPGACPKVKAGGEILSEYLETFDEAARPG